MRTPAHGTPMPDWLPAAAFGGLLMVTLALLQLTRPGVSGQYLIVADPRTGPAGLIDLAWRSGGGLLRRSAVPGLAIVLSDAPDFARRLRAEGAWLVLPNARDLGCASGGGAS